MHIIPSNSVGLKCIAFQCHSARLCITSISYHSKVISPTSVRITIHTIPMSFLSPLKEFYCMSFLCHSSHLCRSYNESISMSFLPPCRSYIACHSNVVPLTSIRLICIRFQCHSSHLYKSIKSSCSKLNIIIDGNVSIGSLYVSLSQFPTHVNKISINFLTLFS